VDLEPEGFKAARDGPKPRVRLASDDQTAAIKGNFPRGIAQPALRALAAAGLTTLGHLTLVTREELSQMHGMGPKAIETLRGALKANDQDFRQG
jgi:hypothetical protein